MMPALADPEVLPDWVVAAETCVCPPAPFAMFRRKLLKRRRDRRYNDRLYAVFAEYRRGPCERCRVETGSEQMAHLAPTSVCGRSRGKQSRARDVMKHPEAYARLCVPCHRALDRGEFAASEIRA